MGSDDLVSALRGCLERMDSYYPEIAPGGYVRHDHFNVVNRCMALAVELASRAVEELEARGAAVGAEVYAKLEECRFRVSAWSDLRAGDMLRPEHENTLIDTLRCVEELLNLLRQIEL